MELIDRYLQAVGFWLPRAEKQDILAELSEDIRAQVEERESEVGRPLSETEVGAVLKQRGRPVLVANRYQPQDQLIGPVLFPIYKFVLKISLLFCVLPRTLVFLGMLLWDPRYRLERLAHGWATAAGQYWGDLWTTLFVTAGIVTIVFAVLERAQRDSGWMEKWDPKQLPPLRMPNRIRRSNSVVELVFNGFVVGWWASAMQSPIVWNHGQVVITMRPIWTVFYWAFLAQALFGAGIALVNLARPYWTVERASLRLAVDVAGAGLFCWLMRANVLAGLTVAGVAPARTAAILQGVNYWMEKCFPFSLIVLAIVACAGAVRVWKVQRGCTGPTRRGAAVAAL